MSREIKLTQDRVAIVDGADYEQLSQFKWSAQKHGDGWYAIRYSDGGRLYRKRIYMHREILQAPAGTEVDHINHNGLDNRRENIRLATKAQNSQNRGANKNNTSGYKGVTFSKSGRKWQASIRVNCKRIYIGQFTNKKEAARAYDQAAIKYHGEFAGINGV